MKNINIKNWILLIVGLFIMSFGVAFSIKADLGTSPISSLPYVTSLMTNSKLTVGNTTIIMHCFLILLQILILQKDYKLFQLLQLPIAFIFGYMTDFAVFVTQKISYSNYFEQWLLCVIGIILVGIGVSFEVTSNVLVLAGEGVVLAVVQKFKIKFKKAKIGFDVTLVTISVILSLCFLHKLCGVREGTVAAAIFVGITANFINKILKKIKSKISTKKGVA